MLYNSAMQNYTHAQGMLDNFLANLPFTKPFLDNPGLIERLDLAVSNFFVIAFTVAALALIYFLLPAKFKKLFLVLIVSAFIALPFFIRAFWGYAYDTPFALLSFASDLFVLIYLFSLIGKWFYQKGNFYSQLTIGTALGTVFFLFGTLIGLNFVFSKPLVIVHFFIAAFIIIKLSRIIINHDLKKMIQIIKPQFNLVSLLFILVILLPLTPFLFTPAPPDADITTMSEMTGYLLQGKSLQHAASGFKTEWFNFRYPAGLPSLAWGISNLLNVRASESLLLLWVFSYILLIINIRKLGSYFKLNPFLIVLFSLNLTITFAYGLFGGQVQEMLTYAIGIGLIYLIFENKNNLSLACLAAAILLQPIVAIPFFIITLVNLLKVALKKEFIHQDLFGALVLALTLVYIFILGTGNAVIPSQPQMMLNDLTRPIFFKNILMWLNNDTFNLSLFFLILIFALIGHKLYWKEQKIFYPLCLVLVWFLGANLINGLFGATYLYGFTATFQASFSIIAIWILCVGFTYKILVFHFANFKKIFFAAFIMIWLIFLAPGFDLKPVSVFITHSDVRMCRYLEKIMGPKELIANITPVSEKWGMARMSYSFVRGCSSANTLFARVGEEHQIKNGKIEPRPFNQVLNSNDINKIALELKKNKVDYLLVLARPETEDFVRNSKLKPFKQIKHTYLYRLNDF